MPWYHRVHGAIEAALPALRPTQVTNFALLVSALLAKRTLSLAASNAWTFSVHHLRARSESD